jgi:hypothetical protein
MMTNLDLVKAFIASTGNTPFTPEKVSNITGLTVEQVKRAMRDVKVAGLTKRADGRLQVKGRKIK